MTASRSTAADPPVAAHVPFQDLPVDAAADLAFAVPAAQGREPVAGDFYDVLRLGPDLVALLVGDVSGHAWSEHALRSALILAASGFDHPVRFSGGQASVMSWRYSASASSLTTRMHVPMRPDADRFTGLALNGLNARPFRAVRTCNRALTPVPKWLITGRAAPSSHLPTGARCARS